MATTDLTFDVLAKDNASPTLDRVGGKMVQVADKTEASQKRMGAGWAKFGRSLEKDLGFRVDKAHIGLSLLAQFIGGPFGAAIQVAVIASDTLSTVLSIVSIANIRAAASFVVSKTAMLASAVATRVWAAAQWVLNAALAANPIGLVVVAIVGLVAALVLAWKHSETFRRIVTGAFNVVLGAARAVWGWIKANWPILLTVLTGPFGLFVAAVSGHLDDVVGFFAALPARIIRALGDLGGLLFNAGSQLIGGFISGIKSQIGAVASVMSSLPGAGVISGLLGHGLGTSWSPAFAGDAGAFRTQRAAQVNVAAPQVHVWVDGIRAAIRTEIRAANDRQEWRQRTGRR